MMAPVIFKRVGDGRPYPAHDLGPRDWAALPPRPVRLDELVTTKDTLQLAALLDEDSTFFGDLFAHVVEWRDDLYLEDGLHRALRAALQQRHVLHARVHARLEGLSRVSGRKLTTAVTLVVLLLVLGGMAVYGFKRPLAPLPGELRPPRHRPARRPRRRSRSSSSAARSRSASSTPATGRASPGTTLEKIEDGRVQGGQRRQRPEERRGAPRGRLDDRARTTRPPSWWRSPSAGAPGSRSPRPTSARASTCWSATGSRAWTRRPPADPAAAARRDLRRGRLEPAQLGGLLAEPLRQPAADRDRPQPLLGGLPVLAWGDHEDVVAVAQDRTTLRAPASCRPGRSARPTSPGAAAARPPRRRASATSARSSPAAGRRRSAPAARPRPRGRAARCAGPP